MIFKNVFTIALIIFNSILIIIIINRLLKEHFTSYNFSSDEVNVSGINFSNKSTPNIYVGSENDIPINPIVYVGTNNTLFIYNPTVTNDVSREPTTTTTPEPDTVAAPATATATATATEPEHNANIPTVDILKQIKYLPYNFKDKMCLGSSCITKDNLKLLKGKVGFKLLSITKNPIATFYEDKNFMGIQKVITGADNEDGTEIKHNGIPMEIQSYKIHIPSYQISAYERAGMSGINVILDAPEMEDVTSIFENGFASYKILNPSTQLNVKCLALTSLVQEPAGNNELLQSVDCEEATDVFYIDSILNNPTNNPTVDFHEHSSGEQHHYYEN